jgi:PD-(D/E)XK nuclease superfamily
MNELPDIPPALRRDKNNVAPAFAKPLVYSYTMLNTADTCLHRCYRQYVKKDIPYVETPEMAWGNMVHTAFEHRLGGKPLPGATFNKDGTVKIPSMQHWEPLASVYAQRGARPEKKVGMTKLGNPTGFFDKDVWLRGKIDATMLNGAAVFLADWKTGSSKYEDPFELEIQALMLKAAIPSIVKIAGHYVFLKENRVGQVHDLSDFNSTWAKINNKVEVIEDTMAAGEWPKKKGPLCGYCSVIDCENRYDAKAGERPK